MTLSPEQLAALRALRLWHYNTSIGAMSLMRKSVSGAAAEMYQRNMAQHQGAVAALDALFDPADKVEADYVEAKQVSA